MLQFCAKYGKKEDLFKEDLEKLSALACSITN